MHVIDLPLNHALGMLPAGGGSGCILEMPGSALGLNHLGTVHASAQFALAEAASSQFLLDDLGSAAVGVFAVLRSSEVKFRKAAQGSLAATATFADGQASPRETLATRSRATATILVELTDSQSITTFTGTFDWFLQRQTVAD